MHGTCIHPIIWHQEIKDFQPIIWHQELQDSQKQRQQNTGNPSNLVTFQDTDQPHKIIQHHQCNQWESNIKNKNIAIPFSAHTTFLE
jgi:hypothetical protein